MFHCRPLEAHEALPVRQHRVVSETQPSDSVENEEVSSIKRRAVIPFTSHKSGETNVHLHSLIREINSRDQTHKTPCKLRCILDIVS